MMENFYVLSDPENLPDNKYAEWAESNTLESVICPKFKGHQRPGKRTSLLNVIVPKNQHDVIWTWYMECLVTDKVAQLLAKNKFSGYQLGEVHIVKDKREEVNQRSLFELVVTGTGGHIDPKSGYKELGVKCEYCNLKEFQHMTNGFIVKEEEWGGSDIFTLIEYPKFILVTERVKTVFIDQKISGVEFVPASDFRFSD